jgi:hypothetical protein
MISNSTFKAPEKNFNLYLQGTLLFNGIFTPQKEGCFKKKKNAPSCGHLIFQITSPLFFSFSFFFISIEYHKKKSKNKNSSRVLYMGYRYSPRNEVLLK